MLAHLLETVHFVCHDCQIGCGDVVERWEWC
jgi:hypothetical protein